MVLLIKLGSEEHMRNLFEKGIVHMKSLDEYQKFEYGDPLEGTSFIKNNLRVEIRKDGIPMAYDDNASIKTKNNIDYGLAYCVTWKKFEDEETPFKFDFPDKLLIQERTHAVIIYNFDCFVQRFKSVLEHYGYQQDQLDHREITYVNTSEFQGRYGWDKKPNSLSHEQEYRFFLKNINNSDNVNIEIGCIDDISIMVTIDKINSIIIDF